MSDSWSLEFDDSINWSIRYAHPMQQFDFKVVNAEDPEGEVPVKVAGQIMVDVQNLLSDIGELMVRQELRTQGLLPDGIKSRFSLKMKGQGTAAGPKRDSMLLEDALAQLCAELDRANLMSSTPSEVSNHIEAAGRRKIASDMLALADHLDGYVMTYGQRGFLRKFRMNARRSLEKESAGDVAPIQSAIIGVLSRDPVHASRWIVSNGSDSLQASFADGISRDEIASYAGAGPVIAVGSAVLDGSGNAVAMKDITACYDFPQVRFHRIVTNDRDLSLLCPVTADIGFDRAGGSWSLSNDDLGISISKPSWDEAVLAFHEYFMFLWETYAEAEDEFEGEEKEISDLLKSYAFP